MIPFTRIVSCYSDLVPPPGLVEAAVIGDRVGVSWVCARHHVHGGWGIRIEPGAVFGNMSASFRHEAAEAIQFTLRRAGAIAAEVRVPDKAILQFLEESGFQFQHTLDAAGADVILLLPPDSSPAGSKPAECDMTNRELEILDGTVECTLDHLEDLMPHLRPVERKALTTNEATAEQFIKHFWERSLVRRAVLLDGKVLAAWWCGNEKNYNGQVWLLTTEHAWSLMDNYLDDIRSEIRSLLKTRAVLQTLVPKTDRHAANFFQSAGFTVADELDVNGATFVRLRLERATPMSITLN